MALAYAPRPTSVPKYGAQYRIPREPGEAGRYAESARQLWTQRDLRMDKHEKAWQLRDVTKNAGDEILRLNTNAVLVDEIAFMLSLVRWDVQVAPLTEQGRPAAESLADAARWALTTLEEQHSARGNYQFQWEAGFSLALWGWWCPLTLFNPDDARFPWTIENLCPRFVYPDTTTADPSCVVYRYRTSLQDLQRRWGEPAVRRALDRTANDTTDQINDYVTVSAFYSDTEMAVLVDDHWLKPPLAHGYARSPLLRVMAKGTPFRQREEFSSADPAEFIGTGVLQNHLDVVEDMQEVATLMREGLALTVHPPTGMYVNNPKRYNDVPTGPGDTFTARPGESYAQYPPPPAGLSWAQAVLSLGKDGANSAGLPPQAFGAGGGPSGYADTQALAQATRGAKQLLRALAPGYVSLLRLMFSQYASFGTTALLFQADSPDVGLTLGQISPWDVAGADSRIVMRFGSPDEGTLQQQMMTAATGVDRGLLDIETALTEILHFPNPRAIRNRATRDQLDKDPTILRMKALYQNAQNPTDPFAPLYAALLQQTMQQFTQALMTPPGGTAQPGQAPNQPPLPGSGVPSAVLPDELGQNAGLLPNQAALGAPQVGAGLQAIA